MASAHHQPQHQRFAVQTHNDRRLPSIKDLNFPYRPPTLPDSSPTLLDQSSQGHVHPPPPTWPRSNTAHESQHQHQHQHPQHPSPLTATHQPLPPKQADFTSGRDNGGYLTPGVPLSAQITQVPGSVNIGPGARGDDSLKRPRTGSSIGVHEGHPSQSPYPSPQYASYTPSQPPPQPYQVPPPHDQIHHPGYAYAQQYIQPRHPQHPHPPQPPIHAHHHPPGNPYPPPTTHDPWEHHRSIQHQQHQPPHPQQSPHSHQQHIAFSRTTPIVPTNLDSRSPQFSPNDIGKATAREGSVSEIVRHCSALFSFASRYAQLQASMPQVQPLQAELSAMSQRAGQVVRLLEGLRRMSLPESERLKLEASGEHNSPDDHRPPKRPWEDQNGTEGGPLPDNYNEKPQTTAEQDMQLIRTKRATSTASGTAASGLPKSKYRKRSRATPPGKCHSCNIRETPEWRRGPDGARTLCNACGLHYAKLMRKRDKGLGPGTTDTARIDMDTLRASARANEVVEKAGSRRQSGSQSQSSHQADQSASPSEHQQQQQQQQQQHLQQQPPQPQQQQQQQQQHHQGSFQLVAVMGSAPTGQSGQSVIAPPTTAQPMSVPPPSWATSATAGGRGYVPDPIQHQSFIRAPQHATSNGTSPR